MPYSLRRLVPADALTRRLALATLVNTFGNGLFFSISALYFTRIVGLPVTQVGLGLTIAGGLGVLAGVPAGSLADRFGSRRVFAVLAVIEAAALCTYPFVDSVSTFLLAVCAVQVCDRANSSVRNALIAVAVPPEARANTRAYLRAVTNVGIGCGAALGALALQADTRGAYVAMILGDAVTFVASAAIMIRLAGADRPPVSGDDAARPSALQALRDLPYLSVTVLNGVLAIQFALFDVGLPLWVVGHTAAPRVLVSAVLIVNTVLVVALQVRATRGMDTPRAAARGAVRAGALLALCCLLYGAADNGGALTASLILLAGCLVHTLGEVMCSAAGFTLSYDLADTRAPGVYQGVFQSGFNAGVMISPLVITSTALRFGFAGWVALGAVFVGCGLLLVPATRWAQRTRVAPEPVTV